MTPTTCAECDAPAAVFRPDRPLCKPHYHQQRGFPHPTDHDLFLNALGALLGTTLRSEFDDDDCENAL